MLYIATWFTAGDVALANSQLSPAQPSIPDIDADASLLSCPEYVADIFRNLQQAEVGRARESRVQCAIKMCPMKRIRLHVLCQHAVPSSSRSHLGSRHTHSWVLLCNSILTEACIGLQLKRRPSTTYMEVVQHDINVSMRTILIDWLVEVVQVGCGSGWLHFTRIALRAHCDCIQFRSSSGGLAVWLQSSLNPLQWHVHLAASTCKHSKGPAWLRLCSQPPADHCRSTSSSVTRCSWRSATSTGTCPRTR